MKNPLAPLLLRRKAEHFLQENGFNTLPICPFTIAEYLEITVEAKPATAAGVSGMLVRHGDAFGILYATHIPSPGFQRFSIAHELAHFLLEGHPEALFADGSTHASRAGFATRDPYEIEADHFAAGLLMPEHLFRSAMRRVGDGLEAIEELAEKCVTSLTATAIRFAQAVEEPAAVVVSTGPRAWFGTRRPIAAMEEVVGLGEYGRTLTVITTDTLPDEEDEEAQLEESWTPRHRR